MDLALTVLAVSAVVLMTTALVAWPRRHTAHWIVPFLGLALAISVWSIGYALELSFASIARKLLWAQVQYIGITFTAVSWFIFAYVFRNPNIPNLKAMTLLLSIVPIATIIIAFTNNQHGLLWAKTSLDDSGFMPMLSVEYGSWFWVHSAYSYLLILGGIGLFVRTLRLFPNQFRRQSVILILAAGTPLVGNALYLAGLSPIPQVDPTPFAFSVSALLIAWGVVRLDMFDITPVARRVIVESLPDGVILLDIHDRVMDINQKGRQLLSLGGKKVIGQSLSDLPTEVAQTMTQYKGVLEIDDEIAVRKDGRMRHFNIRIRPFHTPGLHPKARVLILRDITRRIAAEKGIRQRNLELQQLITEAQTAREDAEKANLAKSELLAKVSHELRTPLGGILGYAEMLQEGVYGTVSEEQHHFLQRIVENTGYLNEQVNDLLDLSRISAGTLEVKLYEFDVEDAVQQVATRIEPLAKAKDLALKIVVSPNLPRLIVGNSIRFQQILVNLATNAIKFTERGHVSIDVSTQGEDFWTIQVTDSGIGIPDADLEKIFQPFHQIEGSIVEGVGLGLTIVHELTLALGGKIEIGTKLGKGSIFKVILPLHLDKSNNLEEHDDT